MIQVNHYFLDTKNSCVGTNDFTYESFRILFLLGSEFEKESLYLRPVIELVAIQIYPNTVTSVFFK